MANNTKIRVMEGAAPIVGATLVVGDVLGQVKETDEDGRIAFDLDPGAVHYVHVHITLMGGRQAIGLLLLTEGQENVIYLG